jgi:hypothetical protein
MSTDTVYLEVVHAVHPTLDRPVTLKQVFQEMGEMLERVGVYSYRIEVVDDVTQEHARNSRRYAQMYVDDRGVPVFEFAEQMVWLPYPQRAGLYVHEIGHYLDPDPRKTEDGADAAGMVAFDCLIFYDRRWPGKGLQTAVC